MTTDAISAVPIESWWESFKRKLDSPHIPALDALRAASILLVILYHFGYERVNGAFGVEVFFVISGFLITWLLLKENQKTGAVSLTDFYKRRTLRIFPAFYAFMLFSVAVALVRGHDVHWPSALAALFYVGNYYQGIFHPLHCFAPDTWSLSIEEQFYLLWPLAFCFLKDDLRKVSRLLWGLIALVWLNRLVLFFRFHVHPGYIYHAFDTRADHLLAGCLLAVLLKREAWVGLWRRLCARAYYPLATIALLAFSSLHHGNYAYRYGVAYMVEPFLIAILIVQLIHFSSQGLWRFTEAGAVRYFGRISYSLYLYQALTLFTAAKMTEGYPWIVRIGFALGVTAAFASASYYLIEKPFLRLKDKSH